MTTRMIWVLIFAVLVGVMLWLFARSFRSGGPVNQVLLDIGRANETLSGQYPGYRFVFRSMAPRPGVRNLVVAVESKRPGADITSTAVDSVLVVSRNVIHLRGFDSLVVVVAGEPVRSELAR